MADISRLRKKRSANRNVALGLFTKAKDFMAKDYSVENKEEIETLLKTIESKECIKDLDAQILDVIDEKLIEEDIDVPTQFETKFNKYLLEITNYLLKNKDQDIKSESLFSSFSSRSVKAGVKLPKIIIKKFKETRLRGNNFMKRLRRLFIKILV